MNVWIQEGVFHITYQTPSDLPPTLLQLADDYEGVIPHRVGWNLPLTSSARRTLSTLFPALAPALSLSSASAPGSPSPSASAAVAASVAASASASASAAAAVTYLIVYPAKDIQTKKHELLHARYAMDPTYRQQVMTLWKSLSLAHQTKVLRVLRDLQYPEREELLVDEFQAYYFTEPSRFFGIPSYPLSPLSPKKKRK